ncbi:exodeoxyribonuclease V subunit gamma [Mycolicibacterium neworleansense]|uniref:RecBCD enzyme subunit RecC n=1 Tax=Mycolicibacterium neworleansense TaxID=146018 RepID=A0A0H5RRU2_9MYCO|nr:exodeoxyribonuclease V subunit gamma [Mycolicibacterium neworleansense]MCV7365412.1 exodeoxyribonuclease V subunit gamma [Mycolicibacterium neworleansense]CRZ16217.1 exodeoxyribonuclease V subunit gamma [Mycolicibacterium neworleansense]
MALHLHRAERTDLLADGLAGLLAQPPSDPFAQELVLVPAKGVERWLSQRLSNRLGVCAAVEFRNPRSLIAELTGTAEEDPWSADAMAWPLLAVIDENLDQPWCAPVAAHLGHFETGDEYELRQGRRYAVARRLAGLFASYARQRPQLLLDWDGLPDDLSWQAPLWRALTERIEADPPHIRHAKTLARLTESRTDLPERLSLFGHTRLPVTEIELLTALATHHDLHLWLPHPSDDLWQSLAGHTGPLPRREDSSHRDVGHPLLATLGRDLRELQRGLPVPDTDEYLSRTGGTAEPDTVLGWLQSDIAANAVRPAGRVPRPEDRSVQVHSCHGPARQIEVLREVLLGLLADDPTLEPRDILVMCPDIETYAPLITAGFGLGDVVRGAHPAHKLRVRLADRALVQTNPLLSVAASVLALASGRATASEVLNLAESAPVRARFGFTDDDLEAITAWVREANIRWGFDQEHRSPYGVEFLHNTWRFGIDRVLAGVAMSDDSHAWLGTTLPLDDVSSNRVELAGRFADFVEKLRVTVGRLSGVRPLGDWLTALSDGIDALAYSDEEWPAAQVQREFAEIAESAGAAATPMRLSDIRALLDRHLAGRPTRANFRTGTLTVCTMVPMRSVPHRVVCLVGLDDGVFPRLGAVDGDDVLARDPRTGERDIRSEDRQLLLDAIGAATQTLVITYTGANEYSGQARPPAVPLAELLDTLKVTAEQPVAVVTTHPLQPFDIRNVTPGALLPEGPFTFDPTALTAAQASAGQRAERPPFFDHPLPAPATGDVALADLVTFFKDPVKGFFRALEYTLPWDVDGVSDEMPVDIDALEEWTVGDRMLNDILRGMTPADAQQAEWRRGTLPPGQLGWRRAIALRDQCALLAAEALRHRSTDPQAYDVDIDLGTGRRLAGTVSPVFGDRLVSVTYSKLDGKHLLQSWIPLLALDAGHPGRDWSAVCIGRPRRGDTPRVAGLGRPDDPVALLADLVAIYDAGRREPLPLPIKTSYAWAVARHAGDDPQREAGFRWRSSRFPGEDEAPAHVRAWGRGAPLSRLAGLGEYSERLWLPLLEAERSPS